LGSVVASRLSVVGELEARQVTGGEILLEGTVRELVPAFAVRGEQPGTVAQVLLEAHGLASGRSREAASRAADQRVWRMSAVPVSVGLRPV
jgi:hypothetical protein